MYNDQWRKVSSVNKISLRKGPVHGGVGIATARPCQYVREEIAPVAGGHIHAEIDHVTVTIDQVVGGIAAGWARSEQVELLVSGEDRSAWRDGVVDIPRHDLEDAVLPPRDDARPGGGDEGERENCKQDDKDRGSYEF